jgi:hypothetical protein
MHSIKKAALALGAATLSLSFALPALAQDPPAAAPQGAGGGQGRGQGRGPGRGMNQVSLAQVPISILETSLGLKADQKAKIKIAQDGLAAAMKEAREGAQGGQADPEAMRATIQRVMELNRTTETEIVNYLDDAQKAKIPALQRELGVYGAVGIPLPALAELNLTADQKKRIAIIAEESQKALQAKMQEIGQGGDRQAMMEIFQSHREATVKKGHDLLDANQKKVIAKYPQQRFGGFGGGRRPGGQQPPVL